MGMDLYESHLILTEEEYNRLKNKQLYIKSRYDLKLIDIVDIFEIKKRLYFEELAELIEEDINYLDILKERLTNGDIENIYQYCEKYLDITQNENYPLSLDEFLESLTEEDGYTLRYIEEEKIKDEKFYLLINVKFW
ncbi:MAG: hypothetical protein ACI4PE_02605 [Bacilli bacterium]